MIVYYHYITPHKLCITLALHKLVHYYNISTTQVGVLLTNYTISAGVLPLHYTT